MRGFTRTQAAGMLCPFQSPPETGELSPCANDRCMGWVWLESDYEYGRAPVGEKPAGLGWGLVGTVDGIVTWKRLRSNVDRLGCCARLIGPTPPIAARSLRPDELR